MNFASCTKNLKDNQAKYSPWLERIIICLAVLIAYSSIWPNEFVFDDDGLIVKNEFLKHWSTLPKLLTSLNFAGRGLTVGNYRPVLMLIYFLIYQAFGLSTIAFHALNVSLQALNACLLHHFGIRAGFKKGAAFAAALLWAVHPLHVINVAYMSSGAELLWGSFCLLGLIALLPDFTPRKIWLAMIFFILALGSKESAVAFPALAASTFFFVSKYRTQIAAYLKMWPLWLLAAVYITAWLLSIDQHGSSIDNNTAPLWSQYYASNFTNRVLTSLATLPVYARLIVWPTGLHMERTFRVFSTLLDWQPVTGVLMVGLAFLQILWGRARRGPALSFGFLWFAATLSPYTGIVIPIDAVINETWLYVPTMGLFLGMMQTAAGFFEKRRYAAWLLVCAMSFSLGITTFLRNEAWLNPETLYQNILQNGGHAERIKTFLGMFYMRHQEFDKAIEQFQYELDHSDDKTKGVSTVIHLRLAIAWLHIPVDENENFTMEDVTRTLPIAQHIPEAIGELEKALQDDPGFYFADAVLAAIYHYQGNSQRADFYDKQVDAILRKQRNSGP
ncbi:MAG: hypothetical protein WCD70_09910 [Alphaproteobacteria bacterium]